ncbi:hypothetical protein DMB42_22765 [Nonomuraea sp. WAC 01424]|uniref:hypothetical protein n=1 Tax=Nonomuraea sp. WAC 01424 TaxID=2203200 RepID=UPI000F7A24C1|nr:hypothetical protein [Nonomuraea sp. WAC 01424]RSN07476.1 hypothetical protein DMB42_22765 [Nonomuraea sp. WAC 01424]
MNIADLARVRDDVLAGEPVGRASGAGARALMESITAEERGPVRSPRRRAPRRMFLLGVVAAGLAAVLAVMLPLGGPATEYANAAVTLKTGDDFIDVVITDPEADAAIYTEAFRAVGLDATVQKIPVAPEYAGMLFGPATPGEFPSGTGVTVRGGETCASVWCGTVSMPTGYKGKVIFGIGRPARPGERYAARAPSTIGVAADGVAGVKLTGKPVSHAKAELSRRGLKIEYVALWMKPDGSGGGYDVASEHVKDDWIVDSAIKVASDTVRMDVVVPADVPMDSLPRAARPPSGWRSP